MSRTSFIDEQGKIVTRRPLMTRKTRISFFAAFLSGQELDRSGQLWQDLSRAIELRDRCVHPKPPFPFETTLDDAEHVINTAGAVMREISRLAGLEPQRWWADVSADSRVDGRWSG